MQNLGPTLGKIVVEIGKTLGKAIITGVGLELARVASLKVRRRLGEEEKPKTPPPVQTRTDATYPDGPPQPSDELARARAQNAALREELERLKSAGAVADVD